MKNTCSVAIAALVLFSSCKQDSKELLTREWRAYDLDNAKMEMMMTEQATFIDTFGTHTDALENQKLYGTANVDSVRPILRQELEDYKKMQENAVKNTWFRFRQDGVALMNFSGQKDSASWYFSQGDSVLVLDEKKLKGAGNILEMNIIKLTEDTLKLRYMEEGLQSIITFRPVKK